MARVFECDKCKVNESSHNSIGYPKDWRSVAVQYQGGLRIIYNYCPACAKALNLPIEKYTLNNIEDILRDLVVDILAGEGEEINNDR